MPAMQSSLFAVMIVQSVLRAIQKLRTQHCKGAHLMNVVYWVRGGVNLLLPDIDAIMYVYRSNSDVILGSEGIRVYKNEKFRHCIHN